eukprot:8216513-Prorocentrum_lima.AAC.1
MPRPDMHGGVVLPHLLSAKLETHPLRKTCSDLGTVHSVLVGDAGAGARDCERPPCKPFVAFGKQ